MAFIKRITILVLVISLLASGFYILGTIYLDVPEAMYGSTSPTNISFMGFIPMPSRVAMFENSLLYTIVAVVEIVLGLVINVADSLSRDKEKREDGCDDE